MAVIINIDTSSPICSVALAIDGEIVLGLESSQQMDHSASLAPYVKKCLDYLKDKGIKLDAVSVAVGPGSYTGLRIGLSLAKGLAFGMSIPMIALSSLQILSVRAIFSYHDFAGDELIVPMVDARRLEVFTGVYDSALQKIIPEQPLILDENSFWELYEKEKVLFIGDGSEKFKNLYKGENAVWLGARLSHAKFMVTLSEKLFRNNQFSDIAYTVPNYLKEYQTTTPKCKI